MKTRNIWNLLLIVPLMLAVAAGPVGAQSNEQTGTPPAAPAPPAPEVQSTTNGDQISKTAPPPNVRAKNPPDSEHKPVRIDNGGIRVGRPYVNNGPQALEIVGIVSVVATACALPVALLAVFLHFRHRRNTLLHETLRAMVDKGVPIPPELLATRVQNTPRRRSSDLRRGVICAGVGLGLLMMALGSHGPGKIGLIGFIPLFIGAAFLISWKVEQPKLGEPEN